MQRIVAGPPRREIVPLAGGRWLVFAEPLQVQEQPPARGWLLIVANTEEREGEAAVVVQQAFRIEIALLLSVGLGWWLLRSLLLDRSLRLQRSAESLMPAGEPQPSGVTGNDELGVIGRAMDSGILRIQRQERLLRLGTACSKVLGGTAPLDQRLRAVCRLLREQPEFGLVVLLGQQPGAAGGARVEPLAGELPAGCPLDAIEHLQAHPQHTWRPLQACLRQRRPVLVCMDDAPEDDPLTGLARHCRLRTFAAVPVMTPDASGADAGLLLGLLDSEAGDRALAEVLDLLCGDIQAAGARDLAEQARRRAEDRESLAMEAAELGAWEFGIGSRDLRLSARAMSMLGLDPQKQHSLRRVLARLHPQDVQTVRARLRAVCRGSQPLDEEIRVCGTSGVHWLLLRGTCTQASGRGRLRSLAGVLIDIDARKQAEASARLASEVFQQSQLGIMVCDAERRIIDVNAAFERITGCRRDEALGRTPDALGSGLAGHDAYADLWAELHLSGNWSGELWNTRGDNEAYPLWLTMTRIDDAEGQPLHYIGQFVDTSDRKAFESRIEYLGAHDLLTGLPRRERLISELSATLSAAPASLALLHLDVDRFRRVNESLGYDAGNSLLRALATRLRARLPATAELSRIGADEFLVMLPGLDERQARELAVRLKGELCAPLEINGSELAVGLSIGLALWPADAEDAEGLAAAAELALAAAQASGRDDVQRYSHALAGHSLAALTLESQLRLGLARREFVLVFQPQIDLADGGLCGYEALVRWQHPERGLLPPGQFIELAERSGLILPLGEFVLREACDAAQRLRRRGLPAVLMSVNVSALQFGRPEFFSQVESALAESGLPPEALELELTESVLMEYPEHALQRIEKLRGLGLKLAIDDFGTGFSSMSYLGRLRPDRLKIDKSFVLGMEDSASNRGVVRAVLALAEEFALGTVAEGVETAAAAEALRGMGCQVAQGYLFARPLPEAQLQWPLATARVRRA